MIFPTTCRERREAESLDLYVDNSRSLRRLDLRLRRPLQARYTGPAVASREGERTAEDRAFIEKIRFLSFCFHQQAGSAGEKESRKAGHSFGPHRRGGSPGAAARGRRGPAGACGGGT